MAFLGPNDILVLEKETGLVKRILNGKILPTPLKGYLWHQISRERITWYRNLSKQIP